MLENYLIYIVAGLFLWLLVLSSFLVYIFVVFRNLTKDVKEKNLLKILDRIDKKEKKNSKDIKALENQLEGFIDKSRVHIQKVSLVRFNPFEELGGDHSFSLAVLDANNSGFILTGLHTRERTRVYMKRIKKGKSKYDLSAEEQKTLDKARKGK